MEETHQSVN